MPIGAAPAARLALPGTLVALAALAWVASGELMSGMESMPGMDLGGLGSYVAIWVAMMAAMMLPSVAPTVVVYERRRSASATAPDATALFVAGYLLAWTLAGLAAYALFEWVRELDPRFLAWDEAGRWVTAGAIVTAVAYQLTPAKRACLHRCRSAESHLAKRWREGRLSALELGLRHGAWCLGCCWALMAALFAVGLMSLGWMALIAAFIAAEKLLPVSSAARRAVAALLLVLALGVALAPSAVPGFSEPGSMDSGAAPGASMRMGTGS